MSLHLSILSLLLTCCLCSEENDLPMMPEWEADSNQFNNYLSSNNSTHNIFTPSDVTYYEDNGEYILCQVGCSNCTTGICTACHDGYTFNATANHCIKCGLNCKTCATSNSTQCSSCLTGAFLSGNTCEPCASQCVACQGSSVACTQCRGGFYLSGSQCLACLRNCQLCNNATHCIDCNLGFTITNNNTMCIGCARGCATCDASDITTCTSCGTNIGLEMVDGSCQSCSDSLCLACSGNICSVCKAGYHPNTSGKCILNCRLPCRTCAEDLPTSCTSCFRGASLLSMNCVFNDACLQDGNCSSCGVATNYYPVSAQNTTSNSSIDINSSIETNTSIDPNSSTNTNSSNSSFQTVTCMECPSISNCLQCSSSNINHCSICTHGYYLDSSSDCGPCPVGCRSCWTGDLCDQCLSGYTLPLSASLSRCLSCVAPCLTCKNGVSHCVTCQQGHTKRGWKCQNNLNTGFKIVFRTATVADIKGILTQVVERILTIMGKSVNNTDYVTIEAVSVGSTVVSGSYDEGTATTETTIVDSASRIQSELSSSSIGGYSVESVSVEQNGVTTTSQSEDSSDNTKLIVGLVIGITLFLIFVILIIILLAKYRQTSQTEKEQHGRRQNHYQPGVSAEALARQGEEPGQKIEIETLEEEEKNYYGAHRREPQRQQRYQSNRPSHLETRPQKSATTAQAVSRFGSSASKPTQSKKPDLSNDIESLDSND